MHEQHTQFLLDPFFNNPLIGMMQVDLEGRYVHVNQCWLDMIGISRADILACDFQSLTHPLDLPRQQQFDRELVSGQRRAYRMEKRYIRNDGSLFWADLAVSGVYAQNGEIIGMVGLVTDISSQKQAQNDLHKHEQLLSSIAPVAQILLTYSNFDLALKKALAIIGQASDQDRAYIFEYCRDSSGSEIKFNQLHEHFNSHPGVPVIPPATGSLSLDHIPPRWFEQLSQGHCIQGAIDNLPTEERYLLEKHNVVSLLVLPIHVDDKFWGFIGFDNFSTDYPWSEVHKSILTAATTAVAAAIVRKRTVEQFIESETRFRTLLDELIHIPIQGYDQQRRVIYWNQASHNVYGYSRDEALGRKLEDLIIPSSMRDQVIAAIDNWHRHQIPIPADQLTLKDKQGNDVPVYSTHVMLQSSTGAPQMYCVDIDLRALDKTEKQRSLLATALEQAGESVVITDLDGTIIYVNSAFCATSGYSTEETLGQDLELLSSGPQSKQSYQDMWMSLRQGDSWNGRIVNRKKDGTLFTEEISIAPVYNAENRIVNYVAVKLDISEQLLLERQYREAQKQEAVSHLAGGIAHDFNNKLAVILAHTELARYKVVQDLALSNHVLEIEKAAKFAKNLTDQLLGFARRQESNPETIEVNVKVEETLNSISELLGRLIRVKWEPAADDMRIIIDPQHLDQILTNLLINARDAMRGQGTIEVTTGTAVPPKDEEEGEFRLSGGQPWIQLSVIDNGCGMSEEIRKKIFEPFFSTKGEGKGTGLGLSMVHGLVKQNQGAIRVTSNPGSGTRFDLFFPPAKH